MQEKLIIYLHAADSIHPSWAVLDEEGNIRQSAYRDNPQGLATIAQGKKTLVLVPAEDVLLTSVTLPKMAHSRLVEALPYALEEKLIADVETLHFAVGEKLPNGDVPVAIVAREKMHLWLTTLQAWNIKDYEMQPVTFALPLDATTWHGLITDVVVVRTGLYQGFAGDKPYLSQLLQLALAAHVSPPSRIHLLNTTDSSLDTATFALPVEVTEEKMHPAKYIADLARYTVQTPPGIALLQGPFAVKKSPFPHMKKLWLITGYLSVALVCLLGLSPLVSYFILIHSANNIDAEVTRIYKHHFPNASSITAPKLRMEEKLQKLRTAVGENRLLLLLGYVGKGMSTTTNISLKRFEFQNNQLTLEVSAASSEDIAAFTNFLTQQSLTVKQQNANLAGARITATLVIE